MLIESLLSITSSGNFLLINSFITSYNITGESFYTIIFLKSIDEFQQLDTTQHI